MISRFKLLTVALVLGSGRQVVFVDLSQPPQTPEPSSQEIHVRGGRIYDGGVKQKAVH